MLQAQPQRLTALDGIRGLAIFLVIFNHIPLSVLHHILPGPGQQLLTMLLFNGKTGVSLLFLLSGFLMMWLHPQPKILSFLKKRYLRVFPPFLTMVVSLAFIRNIKLFLSEAQLIRMSEQPWIHGVLSIAIVFTVAVLAFLLWKFLAAVNEKISLGSGIFLGFFGFQVAVALWYVFYLLQVPPAQFYMGWSLAAQGVVTAIVNGTLTLPFGRYIAQLDGVYWTLITETFFYLVYPIFIVQMAALAWQKRSSAFNTLFVLTAFPFFFGLKLISDRVLGLGMMQLQMFSYFIVGVVLALIWKNKENWSKQTVKKLEMFKHPIWIPVGLLAILGSVLLYGFIPNFYHPWVQLFWVFPVSGVLAVSLLPGSSVGRFFENTFLVMLGKYSYSLYLVHSLVVEILTRGKEPNSLATAVWLISAVWLFSLVMARCLYFFVEGPYFALRKKTSTEVFSQKKTTEVIKKPVYPLFSVRGSWIAVSVLTIVMFALTYEGYRSPFAFFTQTTAHTNLPFQISADPVLIPIGAETVKFPFTATTANFGMVATSLRSGEIKDENGVVNASDIAGLLEIRLVDENGGKIAATQYKVHEIGESRYHPFGFPVIADSAGKNYTVEYQMVQPDPSRSLSIVANDAQFTTIYFPGKKQLLSSPPDLFALVFNKVSEPFTKPSTWYAVLHVLPFMIFLWGGLFGLKNGKITK
jgi:peptidoglycan/LPS O-acetylase OafA/YrhL